MKLLRVPTTFGALIVLGSGFCSAALVDIPGSAFSTPDGSTVFHSTANGNAGTVRTTNLRTVVSAFTATVDTIADTAALKNATFVTTAQNSSWNRSVPGSFPNPPTLISESISFSAISASIGVDSSTAAPLFPFSGDRFGAMPVINLTLPSQFVVSGTYEAHGPTQNAVVPFSVTFQLDGPITTWTTSDVLLNVITGNNFPATASSFLTGMSVGRTYIPMNATIFDGTVDGVALNAAFETTFLMLRQVPEPSAAALALLSLGALTVRGTKILRRGAPPRDCMLHS